MESTRICNGHYLCTDCYFRIAFNDDGVLKEEYACPTCRAIELPHTDKGRAHYGKYKLLKLLNADKERSKTIRESILKNATIQQLQKDNIRLAEEVTRLQKRLKQVESIESIEELSRSKKILEDKLTALNLINEKAIADAEASHAAMMHSIAEIANMKKKHKERIAVMKREMIILNDTMEKNQETAERMRDQVISFKDQIIVHALNVRIEHELRGASLLTMKADILEKLDTLNARDDFIPEQLQEDVERGLNDRFVKVVSDLGQRSYTDAINNLASINVAKYMLNKPCIRDDLLKALGMHLREHNNCSNDCKMILVTLEKIVKEVDRLDALENVLQDKVLHAKENIVQLTLPKEVNGLLQAGRNDYATFLRQELPSRHRTVLDFVNKLGGASTDAKCSSTSCNTDPPTQKRKHTDTITIDEEEEVIDCKKKKPATMVNAATQTAVKGVSDLDKIQEQCKRNQSILNISAKKEEYEKKVETIISKWNDEREKSCGSFNHEMLCCYLWNKQVFPNNDVSTLRCFTTVGGCRNPCKLEHKCMYVMPCGNVCLSPDHTYMQHGLFYDMPFSEAHDLYNCGVLTEHQCNLVENLCLNRDARLGLTKYGRICNWISKFGPLDECELPVINGTDIIDESFFN